MLPIPGVIKQFASHFFFHGFECYLVGGAIRDMLMGKKSTDFDLATDARPEEVQKIFPRVIPTGIKHGTVTVLFKGIHFEVTTFRVEGDYQDGRRPESVIFTPSILDDLKRRDFTINAIAFNLKTRDLLDPHLGREDLKNGIIRAIGDPLERFTEDGLRPMRACRFSAQFKFRIEEKTFRSIRSCLDTVRQVSSERIRDELLRMLESDKPSIGFNNMMESGLLAVILPELAQCSGVHQREMHCYDVFEHLLRTCDAADREKPIIRLAALFHDIGKPQSLDVAESGALSFHRHEQISAEIAETITRRLRFSNQVIKEVCHLIRHHMFNYQDEWTDAAVRRFIHRIEPKYLGSLLGLRRADQIGRCGDHKISQTFIDFEDRIEEQLEMENVLGLKDLIVSGEDLMAALSLRPGPIVGILLQFLLESVMDDPDLNQREKLVNLAKNFYKERLV